MIRRIAACLAVALFLLAASSRASGISEKYYEASVAVMGTIGRVQIWGWEESRASKACEEVFAVWRRVDRTMSLYKPSSDLVRLNNHGGQGPMEVSPELMEVLARSREYASRTGCVFDARIGPLMDAWGLGVVPRKGPPPGSEEVAAAKRRAESGDIILHAAGRQAELTGAGMKVDLGGIAKGYALDKACGLLREMGVERAVLDLGGQLLVYNPPPEGWQMGVREPGDAGRIIGILNVTRTCSIAASSQEDRFILQGNARMGHVLDPRTGRPVSRRGALTVVAPTAVEADALSTAFFILGEKGTIPLLADFPGVEVLAAEEKKGRWSVWKSPGMEKLFSPREEYFEPS